MTLSSSLALFAAMVVLAILPGPGILVVVAKSLEGGFRQGFYTSLGIVAGDYIFILLAVFGLLALAELLGPLFVWVKYLGAAYLAYLGLSLMLVKRPPPSQLIPAGGAGMASRNFMAGLLTTLSNPKAILFYVSFFPAFLRLDRLGFHELLLVLLITTLAVGGVMLLYAALALKAKKLLQNRARSRRINLISGSLLLASAGVLVTRN